MKRLWMGEAEDLGWDDPITSDQREEWVELFREILQMEDVAFHRSIKPSLAEGKPHIGTLQ